MIQTLDTDKIVLLGDLHFGKNKFSKTTLESQMRFFDNQLFPYMEENGCKTIVQVGDIFDNRIVVDIEYLQNIMKMFFDALRSKNITFICIVGNHDIYHKSTREYTILNLISRLYENVHVINDRCEILINNKRCYFVPWILPNETLTSDELTGINYVFGHFEIRNFEMTKGHLDDHSMLSPEFFKKKRSLKKVYSGHYHIKAEKETISYLGTPYWLDWGDYGTDRGFFVLDKDFKETFISNSQSTKFIKLKYSDKKTKPLTISGLNLKDIEINEDEIPLFSDQLKPHKLKLFINDSADNTHEEYIYSLKQQGLEFEITNNVEISNIIGESYIETEDHHSIPSSSKTLIKETIKKKHPTLVPVLEELFRELDEVNT
jgi:DNA repair exonuclease SbcCD nuclease subunit